MEKTTKEATDDYFEEDKTLVDFDKEEEEDKNILVESFWNSLVVSDAEQKMKQKKLERLKYRDDLAQLMTKAEYLFFSDCGKISFTRPFKRTKFKDWCRLNTYPISFNNECIDVLGQLTYEFVEETTRNILAQKTPQEGLAQGLSVQELESLVRLKCSKEKDKESAT